MSRSGESFKDAARRVAREATVIVKQREYCNYGGPRCIDDYETERQITELIERNLKPDMSAGHDRNV